MKSLDKKKGKELDWSKNKKAENIVGLRKLPKNSIIFDQPCEIDYHCPVCKYKNVVNGNYDQRLEWSEYNDFIWCSACNKDYPSCLCVADKNKAIDIFLDSISSLLLKQKQQILNLECLKEEKLIDDTKVDYMILEKTWEDNDLKVIRNNLRKEIKKEIKKIID